MHFLLNFIGSELILKIGKVHFIITFKRGEVYKYTCGKLNQLIHADGLVKDCTKVYNYGN